MIVPGARVIAVGTPRLKGANGANEAQQDPAEVVPVTFALTKKESSRSRTRRPSPPTSGSRCCAPATTAGRTLEETIYRGADPKKGKDGVR